jgi:hypothetical protein
VRLIRETARPIAHLARNLGINGAPCATGAMSVTGAGGEADAALSEDTCRTC